MREAEMCYCKNESMEDWYFCWCENCGYEWKSKHHQEHFCPWCGYAFLENWPRPKRCMDCYYCDVTTIRTLADTEPRVVKAICNNGEQVDPYNSWCAWGVVNEEVFDDLFHGDSET